MPTTSTCRVSHHAGSQEIDPKEEIAFLALLEKFEGQEFAALLKYWTTLKDKQVRAAFLNLVKCMANLKS